MIKIFLTVRNRLAITKKCIYFLYQHTSCPFQLYVYNNETSYMIKEHFEYFSSMFKKGMITKLIFNTSDSCFGAFSKASACNDFGRSHQEDPKKHKTEFITFLDNDIIVTPKWDQAVRQAWIHMKGNYPNIKVIGQMPGGIKDGEWKIDTINNKYRMYHGYLGGSAFWNVKSNFFEDVGFLDLKNLTGLHKKHDQYYWKLLYIASKKNPYICGLDIKLGIHAGKIAGSVCDKLTQHTGMPKKEKMINFEKSELYIESLLPKDFYEKIINEKDLRQW